MVNWVKRSSSAALNFLQKDEPVGTVRNHHHQDPFDSPDLSSPSSTYSTPLPITPPRPSSDIAMPSTSPIDIATPSRNASSSPSSHGTKTGNYLGVEDTRTSAIMSSAGHDPGVGRGRHDSFAGAKPISMNNPNRNQDPRMRRESLAGSLVGGMSWGGVSVGSWIRDEYVFSAAAPTSQTPVSLCIGIVRVWAGCVNMSVGEACANISTALL